MPQERRFRVASRCQLLPFLLELPIGLSRKRAKDLQRYARVSVQPKKSVRHDTELVAGDVVTIAARAPGRQSLPEHLKLKIVYLDDAVVVIDKPAGLLSMGSEREKERTAHRILNEHLKMVTGSTRQQAFIVHRLDRDTSGLMIFARTEATQAALRQNWKNVEKKYLAVVEGAPPGMRGTLKDRLTEASSLKVHRVEHGGSLAITQYRVVRRRADRSLLELTLETGRKNQIRVQLAAAGCPIVGDSKYDAKTDPVGRLALHSGELTLLHPVSGSRMKFKSEMPDKLARLV